MAIEKPYDKSSKWLLQHHGGSVLRLAGIENIIAWRPLQAEVVQPRGLPDGLLEAQLEGKVDPTLFLIELATFPERRLIEQLTRGMLLVYLDRGILPEALAIILHPKGRLRIGSGRRLKSALASASCLVRWRVIELWDVPAEQLFAASDVGLIPWVPLTKLHEPVDAVFHRCRTAIQAHAGPQQNNLLAVTQVLARLRYNDEELLNILGGREVMLELPIFVEVASEAHHKDILAVLEVRFGDVPDTLAAKLRKITDEDRLIELARQAAICPGLKSFESRLRKPRKT